MKNIRSVMLFAAGIAVGALLTQSTAAQQARSTGHRINHVGISVANFDESLKFYTQVMGFKEAYRFPSQNGQPSTTFLQVNRDTFIEMAPANGRPAGLTHIGLYSDDAQATVTQLRQKGAMAGDVRPSASTVNGSRSSGRFTQGRSATSIPCPIATSLRVRSGNVRAAIFQGFCHTLGSSTVTSYWRLPSGCRR